MKKLKEFITGNKKIFIPVALAILFVIGGITVYAVNTFTQAEPTISETESQPESQTETETEELTANVSIKLKGVTADNVAIPAEVEIILDGDAELLDGESKTVEDMKLALNDATEIAKLPIGNYTINLLTTPIEIDGSTYKLPSETISFVISGENQDVPDTDDYTITYDEEKNITISITLERLDVNDMTKEQLEAVIIRIQTETGDEHQDLINDLTSKSEQAESNPESASDIAQESESTGESKTTTGNSSSNSSNDTSTNNNTSSSSSNDTSNTNNTGSTGSTNNNTGSTSNSNSNTTTTTPETSAPAHTHTWVDHTTQVAREEQYVVREYDEQVQVGSTPVYSYVWTCPICGATFESGVSASRHCTDNHPEAANEGLTITKSQVQTGSTPIYETQHKVEYGTRTVYDTVVDYQYCSGCGQKK